MKMVRVLLAGLLLIIVLTAGAVAWLLFTQSGRDLLVVRINNYTAGLEMPVVFGRLSGNVLGDVRLERLTVADKTGVWLTLEGMRLVWHPWALWHGTPPFEILDVARLVMMRRPAIQETVEEPREEQAGKPLDYLIYIPRSLRLDEAVIETPVTGRRHRLTVEIASKRVVQEISVSTLEGPLTAVSGTVVIGARDEGQVDLTLREAPRGLLGGLLGLPEVASIEGRVTGGADGSAFRLDALDLRAGQTTLAAAGEGMRDGSMVRGSVRLEARDLSELANWLGDVQGTVLADMTVGGKMEALEVGLKVSRSDISVGEVRLAALDGAVSGTVDAVGGLTPFRVAGMVRGWLSGVGEGIYPLAVGAHVSGTQAALTGEVSASMVRKGEWADFVAAGSGVVSPLVASGQVSGTWTKGAARFGLSGAADVDPARVVLRGLRLVGPGTLVSGSGVMDMVTLLAKGQAVVKVQDLKPLAALAGVDARGGMDATVAASGRDGVQVGNVNIGRFEVDYEGYKARLKRAARLAWDGKAGSLSPFELEIAGGSIVAQGRMDAETVAADLTVRNMDIEELLDSDAASGQVNLSATASGRSDAPVVVATGDWKGATGGYPVAVKARGDWREGRLAAVVEGSSDAATVKAEVMVGGGLSLLPFEVGLDEASSLRGVVTANIPLEMFNNLLWASRQQVGGRLSGRATLAGTLAMPDVGGKFILAEGRYSNAMTGICLKNLGAEIVGSQDRFVLSNLKSTDGMGGSLNGSGSIGLQGEKALGAQVALNNLQLFCGGVATGNVDGQLAAQGTLAEHTLSGQLLVGPLNVQLPGASGEADIPQVETVRVKPGEAEKATPLTVTRLAVRVDAPQRIHVRGRGLDAEFGGRIDVGGTTGAPILTGSLSALRGQFTLLDRTLQLRDSSVRFEGPIPPSPYLDIKATTRAQDTDVTVNVTGTASKPQLVLTSDPALPQDEALALLLFGRRLESISAFEAVKLAQATRVLAGLDGGGPGILDKARQTLGVDTLDIGSGDESGDVTVTTGKYLTDKIYLSVQQGAEPEDREFKTEIELTPSVTGNTTVNGEGNQSFGIEWRRNY